MSHEPAPPFKHTSGPQSARMVLVGEAWGEQESIAQRPFAGESGKELFRLLGEAMPEVAPELHAEICAQHKYGLAWLKSREAWLAEASILMTNVFAFRPSTNANKLEAICCKKEDLPPDYTMPTLERGLYVRPEYLSEIDRLLEEIRTVKPNLIVALGNVACWAVLRATNITSIRGAVAIGGAEFVDYKVLPTFHPAMILRQWNWRSIVVADLMKAAREAKFREIRRPQRQIKINPTLNEITALYHTLRTIPPPYLAVDTETEIGQIKCIGFAFSRNEAFVIPFFDKTRGNYWEIEWEEIRAWQFVEKILHLPIPKVWQNGLYDLQYLLRHGIRPRCNQEDTMLLHHSIFPELQKGLGFLGSIYTNEASWKLMRRQKMDTEKRDE